MTDSERGSFHTHEQAVALITAYFKASYSTLLGLVRRKFRSLEPEEMVHTLFVKILDQIDSITADDPVALGSLIERWTAPGYTSRSLINLCRDTVRSGGGEEPIDFQDDGEVFGRDLSANPSDIDHSGNLLENEPQGLYAQSPGQVAAHLDTLRSRQAVSAILQTLLERGRHRRRDRTHITERQLDILVALYDSDRTTTGDSTELTDDELHRLTLEANRRARDRWRDMGGYGSPEAGNQAVAAAQLGISRQAVSQSLKSVAAALTLTRYVAGVLAPPGTLLSPSAIHHHLDLFDQIPGRPDSDGGAKHHSVLIAAAPAVHTTLDRGTRVQPALLVNQNHVSRDQQVEAVHAAGTYLAQLTGTSHPNCVNACKCHTRQLNRAIEI